MQPIAMYTKIHGKGNIELIINDVVNAELMRQRKLEQEAYEKAQEEYEKEREYLHSIINKRDNNRKRNLDTIRALTCKKANGGFVDKAKDVYCFCMGCLIVFANLFVEYPCYDDDDEEEYWK